MEKTKDPKKVAMGKKSRAGGAAFELRVRKDLTEDGWIVDKWSNNVEFMDSLDRKSGIFNYSLLSKNDTRLAEMINKSKNLFINREDSERYFTSIIFINIADYPKEVNPINEWEIGFHNGFRICYKIKLGKLIPAKRKYAGPGRPMAIGTGFPDFISFRNISHGDEENGKSSLYEAIGVECKTNGKLDKIEKQKCQWYLDNRIFGKILIAEKTKVKNKVVIVYHDFEEKYG